jgi:hypothetical protein
MKAKKEDISFTEAEIRFIKKLDEQRVRVEQRYPLLTALLITFGFVSVLYGFEKMIDRVDFFVEHPYVLLVVGLVTLGLTGAVYKKLS